MKRSLYLFPLMTMTALSLSLAACDDKKNEDQTTSEQTTTEAVAPSDTETATDTTTTAPTTTAPAESPIKAQAVWANATAPDATNGAIFATFYNSGTEADKLTGVTVDLPGVTAELHENAMDPTTNTMQMRKVESIDVPAGQTLNLKADSYHVMLMGLATPITESTKLTATFVFEKAGNVVAPVEIAPAGSQPSVNGAAPPMQDHSTMTGTTPEPTTTAPETTTPESTTAAPSTTTDEAPPAPDTTSTTPEAPAMDAHPADDQSAE